MVTSPDDATPLTKQSPSITQETKARFNQLLNAALKESSREQGGLTRSTGSTPKVSIIMFYFSLTEHEHDC